MTSSVMTNYCCADLLMNVAINPSGTENLEFPACVLNSVNFLSVNAIFMNLLMQTSIYLRT